jgi:hypothetical protein
MGAFKRRAIAADEGRRRPAPLGSLADREIDVFCWCNRCGHNAVLSTEQLIRQLGPAIPVPEIGARLRCTGCGSKDVATRPNWPSQGQITRHG